MPGYPFKMLLNYTWLFNRMQYKENIKHQRCAIGILPKKMKIDRFKNLRIGAILTFLGINLFFIVGNIINFLIFFNILQTDDPENRYDIHTPSPPDSNMDILLVFVFAVAYFYMKSFSLNNIIPDTQDNLRELKKQSQVPFSHINDYACWSWRIFFVSVVGAGLYLFSKYILSTGMLYIVLEVIFSENVNNYGLTCALSVLNDLITVCSPLFIVYAYNKYLSAKRSVAFALYLYFIIRNLFATNVLGLVTIYDLQAGAPFLDAMSPVIVGYSIFYFKVNYQAIVRREQELLKNCVVS